MWEWAGRYILEAATIASETVINVIKPWRLILDLLRQLGNEQDTRTVEGMLQAPPVKACGENRALGETMGNVGAAPGVCGRRVGGSATSHHKGTRSHEAS